MRLGAVGGGTAASTGLKVDHLAETRADSPLGRKVAHERRGAADCGQYRQAAGASAEVSRSVPYLNERGRFLLGRAG